MKVIKWIVGILLVLIVVVAAVVYGYLRSTLPDYEGEITVPGITGEVQIIRDSYGMPHIYAANDEDAYFALGYCMAQDRLFQMDLVRRMIRGKLSEVLGPDLVKVDTLFRTLTAGKPIEEVADKLPDDILAGLRAYANGVNYYLENHKGSLPVEFAILGYEPEPWDYSDWVAVHYYMAWDLNSAFRIEMLYSAIIDKLGEKMAGELFHDYPQGYGTIIPKGIASLDFIKTMAAARELVGARGGGSNNWVISGTKSETGMPILANDPHLGLGAPGIWYEAHLVTPNRNVSGSVLPGMPGVVIGANEHIAWGFTNVMADDADFYVEKINPENPNQYEYMGRWEDMRVVDETVKVKGGQDVPIKIRLTLHGPIVDDVNDVAEPKGYSFSMRWTAYDNLQATEGIYYLNTAKDIYDVERAVPYFTCPGQNWVYADDKGNIGYWAAVGIPIREGFSGILPVPGWDGRHEWKGYVRTDLQPHLRNPSRGWIVTSNNKHEPEGYPYVISNYYEMPDRYTRIAALIQAKDKLSVADFERIQADIYSLLAEEWVPLIVTAVSDKELTENEKKALEYLKGWDFVTSSDSVASTVFHATINNIVKNVFQKRLGDDLYKLYVENHAVAFNALRDMVKKGESPWFDDPDTAEVEGLNDVFAKSFGDGVAYLEGEMGKNVDKWAWGDLHTLTMYHPFGESSKLMGAFMNIGPFPMGGSINTVSMADYHLNNPWGVYVGPSLRYITDFADRGNSKRVIPAGISGNFMSPYYDDQVKMWLGIQYRPYVLDKESVDKDAKHTLKMTPQ